MMVARGVKSALESAIERNIICTYSVLRTLQNTIQSLEKGTRRRGRRVKSDLDEKISEVGSECMHTWLV
jgi:hypothetical protein